MSSSEIHFALLRSLKAFLGVKKGRNCSPVEALSFAIAVETDVSEFHAANVLNFNDAVVERAFAGAMQQTHEHIAKLKRELANWT